MSKLRKTGPAKGFRSPGDASARRPTRRMILRGLGGIAIGLPLFDCLLNGNGDAFADDTELPTRFGLWFWGNGVRLANWLPTSQVTPRGSASRRRAAPWYSTAPAPAGRTAP